MSCVDRALLGAPARYTRLLCALATILLSATLVEATLTQTTPGSSSLAGQLLIASPSMGDPRFSRTVILMIKHDQTGALGIVINRPVGERSIAEILQAPGEQVADIEGKVRIFIGGPVEPDRGFIVHSAEYRRPETLTVDTRFAMTSSREILRDMGTNQGPQKVLVAFGYAGWAPGQLENELKRQAWVVAPADVPLVFDQDRDTLWDTAIARRPRDI